MKRFLRMAASAAFVLLLSACARHKIIPDDTLAQIFHDAFLTNAYIGSEGVKTDSLRIYEPIFARYGYTTDDVHYTIGNFSKRKSARLGDVVERAIEMLEREGKIYNQEVAVLDTIDNVARRTFTRTVLADSLIRVGSLRDTARLSFTLDVEPGEYSLSLKYLVDSLDRNQRGLKGSVWLERRDSSRTNVYTTTLRRNREESFSRRFTTDTTHRRLRIDFLTFNARPERPSVTVTDLKVEYIPPTRTAVEKLYEQQLDIRIFADDFLRAAAIPRIASNLLWTPQGLVRHPLLTLGADGRVLSAECCPDPDRLAATEFYAGLLVPDFPADYRAAFDGMRAAALPLSELLPRIVTPGGALVVISGLDYDSLRLTPQSQIRKL